MDKNSTYTLIELFNSYKDAISDWDHVYGRFIASLYSNYTESPSQDVLTSIGEEPDSLESILTTEQCAFLQENYNDVIRFIVLEKTIRSVYLHYDLPDEKAIYATLKISFNKCEDLFVVGAGINHFITKRPDSVVHGVETNSLLWGIGQVYLRSQGWDNVIIYKSFADASVSSRNKRFLILSTDDTYTEWLNKSISGLKEIVAILPKEACKDEVFRKFRGLMLQSGILLSVTTAHAGYKGTSVFYGRNTFLGKLDRISSPIKRVLYIGQHIMFPHNPGTGLTLFTCALGAIFCLCTLFAIGKKSLSHGVMDPINIMWATSAMMFFVCWIASSLAGKNSYNPRIQFTTILNFQPSYNGWEQLLNISLKGPYHSFRNKELLYNNDEGGQESTRYTSYDIPAKSIVDTNLSSYVFGHDENTAALSDLISITIPQRTEPGVKRTLRIRGWGSPLSSNYMDCKITQEILDAQQEGFPGRYSVPKGTYLWHYNAIRPRIGYLSIDTALANSFSKTKTIPFTPKSDSIETLYLLKELLSDFVLEQLHWLGYSPSKDELLKIRVRVPSKEIQNRELRADAFDKLEKDHQTFVSMVKNHKHEVGNLLKFLYYDFDILKFIIEKTGHLSINDVVDRKGSTVKDYFTAIDGYKNAIGQEMMSFWDYGYDKPEMIKLKDSVESFTNTKATSPYDVVVDIPKESNVFFSRKGLSTILRNIFVNAEKHGFKDKSRKDYRIKIWQEDSEDSNYIRLVIANNGAPLPDGITQSNIFEAGVGTGNSEHIGCHTIKEICDLFNGFVSIEQYTHSQEYTISYIITIPKEDNHGKRIETPQHSVL